MFEKRAGRKAWGDENACGRVDGVIETSKKKCMLESYATGIVGLYTRQGVSSRVILAAGDTPTRNLSWWGSRGRVIYSAGCV